MEWMPTRHAAAVLDVDVGVVADVPGPAGVDANEQQSAGDACVVAGLSRQDSRRGGANVGAVQVGADAATGLG